MLRDKTYPQLVSRLLAAIVTQAKAAVARGETVEQARAKLDVAALRAELTRGDAELGRQLDALVLDPGFRARTGKGRKGRSKTRTEDSPGNTYQGRREGGLSIREVDLAEGLHVEPS